MLKSLQVRNYVLIDSLDIEFPAGLIIISGQTGAGKSILLGALNLVLGAKADASMVGEAADKCIVEAVFEVREDAAIRAVLAENDLDWNDGLIVIRRVLGNTGRSRSFVNDEPVSVGVLSKLSSRLVDIHSQHETLLLSDRQFQLLMLDHYAGCTDLLSECRAVWTELQDTRRMLADTAARLQRLSMEKDYNQAVFEKLEKAALRDGELEELEAEQKQLANAEEIREGFAQVDAMFAGDDERASADSMMKDARRTLEKVARYVPAAGVLAERMESSRLELMDILAEVADMAESTDVAPERLMAVEDRMQLLYDLMKKHSCTSVAELIAVRDALSDSLYDSAELEERRHALQQRVAVLTANLDTVAAKLHEHRLKASRPFAEAIQNSIRSLELERAVFDVQLNPVQVSETGADSVLFRFSSTGRNAVDVAKCASGGEMSRIMLCLKAMMARYTNMPSMIFDEIDTGVSGSVADKMGTMICGMGNDMQVFAITHLPQVAAKGEAHYLVSKTVTDDKAVTDIQKITGESRIMEIARMLSGSAVTPEAVANAKTLLG